MNGFDWGAFGVVTLTSLLAIAVGMAVTATIGVPVSYTHLTLPTIYSV